MGEETVRALAGMPFVLLVVDDDVENRANNGSGAAGAAAGGETAATKGIGADGTGFTGASFVFLRRKPAMETVLDESEKRRLD